MNKVLLYTSIFGPYDELREVPPQTIGYDSRCYTDQDFTAQTWRISKRDLEFDLDPVLTARRHKIDLEISCYEFCIYLDGSFQIASPNFIEFMLRNLNGRQIAFFKHPCRNCVYDEAEICLTVPKCNYGDISRQIKKYEQEEMPEDYGLWASGCFAFRNNRAVSEFRRAWWEEVAITSTRDQISLPYIVRKKGFLENISTIDQDIFNSDYLRWTNHKPYRARSV